MEFVYFAWFRNPGRGWFAREPLTPPKSPFNPEIRPFDDFYFTAPRMSDTIRYATNIFWLAGFVRKIRDA
jgi:hypothetical protein